MAKNAWQRGYAVVEDGLFLEWWRGWARWTGSGLEDGEGCRDELHVFGWPIY